MGNSVGVEVTPPRMEDLLLKDQPQVETRTAFGDFNSLLRLWVFKPHEEDELFILNQPVNLLEFQSFQEDYCYVLLHLYRSTASSPSTEPPSVDRTLLSVYPTVETAKSALENLTPRGQSEYGGNNAFSSRVAMRGDDSPTGTEYDLFVWNGKRASPHIRANSLAKCYELNGSLKNGGGLYHGSTKSEKELMPFTSSDLKDADRMWVQVINKNLFFNLLNELYHFVPASTSSEQEESDSDAPRKAHRKRSRKHFNASMYFSILSFSLH